ncbi:hypothetical protein [Tumebacillus flagellatus]|uniref:hypothetical protein n=1 Tax=Tumebacillus flagellatus TaxID=1157490 RepID=UPI00068DAE05|nr:hypothetical protein [Tumebacillus flagellatus]
MVAVDSFFSTLSRWRVLVIGDLMLDRYLWGRATRLSPEAPVPVVEVLRESYVAGGAGAVDRRDWRRHGGRGLAQVNPAV